MFWLSLVPFATAWPGQTQWLSVRPSSTRSFCSSVPSPTRSFNDRYCTSTASMPRSSALSKLTFAGCCQSRSMLLRCVRRSSQRSFRTSFSSPWRVSCPFPDGRVRAPIGREHRSELQAGIVVSIRRSAAKVQERAPTFKASGDIRGTQLRELSPEPGRPITFFDEPSPMNVRTRTIAQQGAAKSGVQNWRARRDSNAGPPA